MTCTAIPGLACVQAACRSGVTVNLAIGDAPMRSCPAIPTDAIAADRERLLRAGMRLSRPIEEELSHARQVDAPRRPLEELDAKLLFELADRLAERGLRDVQLFGCSAEVERLGNRNEVPQLTQVGTHQIRSSRIAERAARARV